MEINTRAIALGMYNPYRNSSTPGLGNDTTVYPLRCWKDYRNLGLL